MVWKTVKSSIVLGTSAGMLYFYKHNSGTTFGSQCNFSLFVTPLNQAINFILHLVKINMSVKQNKTSVQGKPHFCDWI